MINLEMVRVRASVSEKGTFDSFCRDWSLVKDRVRDHPDFDAFFVEYPEDTTWMEADLFDGNDASQIRAGNRIPYEILEMPDAETVFKNHLNHMHAHQHIME